MFGSLLSLSLSSSSWLKTVIVASVFIDFITFVVVVVVAVVVVVVAINDFLLKLLLSLLTLKKFSMS